MVNARSVKKKPPAVQLYFGILRKASTKQTSARTTKSVRSVMVMAFLPLGLWWRSGIAGDCGACGDRAGCRGRGGRHQDRIWWRDLEQRRRRVARCLRHGRVVGDHSEQDPQRGDECEDRLD